MSKANTKKHFLLDAVEGRYNFRKHRPKNGRPNSRDICGLCSDQTRGLACILGGRYRQKFKGIVNIRQRKWTDPARSNTKPYPSKVIPAFDN